MGHIRQYQFAMPQHSLEKTVDEVYKLYPEFSIPPGTIYRQEGTGYKYDYRIVVINESEQKYALSFAYVGDSIYWQTHNTSVISFVAAAKYGEVLELSKDINWFKKRKFAKLFEKHFIEKVEEVSGVQSTDF